MTTTLVGTPDPDDESQFDPDVAYAEYRESYVERIERLGGALQAAGRFGNRNNETSRGGH